MALQYAIPLDAGTLQRANARCLPRVDAAPCDATLARFAVESLIEEAQLTPKPALVDGRGS
ncbi:MAG: triphosphoribosyl-dephospho-CoA synthase MdcB, partial [Paraburkholderia hospita]